MQWSDRKGKINQQEERKNKEEEQKNLQVVQSRKERKGIDDDVFSASADDYSHLSRNKDQ